MSLYEKMINKLVALTNPEIGVLIETWSTNPTALQIVYAGDEYQKQGIQTDSLVFTILETMLVQAIIAEDTTFDEVIAKAEWRKDAIAEAPLEEVSETEELPAVE